MREEGGGRYIAGAGHWTRGPLRGALGSIISVDVEGKMRKKKIGTTVEERAIAAIMAELSRYPEALVRDHAEYKERLRRKRAASAALSGAEAAVERLHQERIELKKRFWEAYYEQNETGLKKIEARGGPLERAAKRAQKALDKARAEFEKADFDEAAESFALKAKADVAREEVDRRIRALEKAIGEMLAGLKTEVGTASKALQSEYEEPSFDTPEEREAHVRKTIGILDAVARSYTPGR